MALQAGNELLDDRLVAGKLGVEAGRFGGDMGRPALLGIGLLLGPADGLFVGGVAVPQRVPCSARQAAEYRAARA